MLRRELLRRRYLALAPPTRGSLTAVRSSSALDELVTPSVEHLVERDGEIADAGRRVAELRRRLDGEFELAPLLRRTAEALLDGTLAPTGPGRRVAAALELLRRLGAPGDDTGTEAA